MKRAAIALLLLLGLSPGPSRAQEPGELWLSRIGAGELPWNTTAQPVTVVPRGRDLTLPDTGFIGKNTQDKPDDYELPGPFNPTERRYLRYVHGQLVDAWLLREGAIDTSEFAAQGVLEWRGPVLGPGEKGTVAYGDATSWLLDGRTALHWRDRLTNREVLVSRAVSPGQYAVRRASPLQPSAESGAPIKLKGTLKEAVKPYASHLSSCLETAPKPVVATLTLRFDSRGRPARLYASTDQPAPDFVDCVAAALADVTALPDTEGSLEALRMR